MLFGLLFQLVSLVQTCSPEVAPETMLALVSVASGGEPLAIQVVGAKLKTPPTSQEEAVTVSNQLEELKKTFSVGIAQLPQKQLAKLGLTYELAFDPCENLRAASLVLGSCYQKAKKRSAFVLEQTALSDALSCYRFGNFTQGYEPGEKGEPSYVEQVRAAVQPLVPYVVPALTLPFSVSPSFSWPFPVSVLPSPAPVPLQVVPPTPAEPEPSVLVPLESCQEVVLGSPCAPASLPSAQERKEKTIPKTLF